MKVTKGSKVKVQYVGKLTDGTVFDRSADGKPLEFTVGEGKLIKGFECGVEGMGLNDEKTVSIASADGYGPWNKELLRRVGKQFLTDKLDPAVGMVIKLHLPSGGVLPATITEILENELVVDLNHPLAGKDLLFDIKVVGIE